MFSKDERAVLRRELESLSLERARLARVDERINAIKVLLQDERGDEIPTFAAKTDRSPSKARPGGTFRTAVREALVEVGGPTTTDEIVATLERRGIRAKGKTKLKTLVASELWRAERKHEGIKRIGHGRYQAIMERKESA